MELAQKQADPWRNAYQTLQARGLHSGLRIATVELYLAMGIPRFPSRRPQEPDNEFAKRASLWSLRVFVPQLDELALELLSEHGLWLHSRGPGEYELRNADAAAMLADKTHTAVARTLDRSISVLAQMSDTGLTDQERVAYSDAQARIAKLRGLVNL